VSAASRTWTFPERFHGYSFTPPNPRAGCGAAPRWRCLMAGTPSALRRRPRQLRRHRRDAGAPSIRPAQPHAGRYCLTSPTWSASEAGGVSSQQRCASPRPRTMATSSSADAVPWLAVRRHGPAMHPRGHAVEARGPAHRRCGGTGVTNNHVVKDPRRVPSRWTTAPHSREGDGRDAHRHRGAEDRCPQQLPYIQLGNSASVKPASGVAMGQPVRPSADRSPPGSFRRAAATSRWPYDQFIQVDAPIKPGNSADRCSPRTARSRHETPRSCRPSAGGWHRLRHSVRHIRTGGS